jgi:hypothetical protein
MEAFDNKHAQQACGSCLQAQSYCNTTQIEGNQCIITVQSVLVDLMAYVERSKKQNSTAQRTTMNVHPTSMVKTVNHRYQQYYLGGIWQESAANR